MFEHEAGVLLSLSRDMLDRARVMAGKATTALKLPVSPTRPSSPTLRARPRRFATSGAWRVEPGLRGN
jgi:hypothetical protein